MAVDRRPTAHRRRSGAMPFSDAPLIATLPAQDIERATRWYEDKLGFAPSMDLKEAGQLYRSGGSSWLVYQTPSAGTGKHTLGSFIVPDIHAPMRQLRARGVNFQDYAIADQSPTHQNGARRDEA